MRTTRRLFAVGSEIISEEKYRRGQEAPDGVESGKEEQLQIEIIEVHHGYDSFLKASMLAKHIKDTSLERANQTLEADQSH